MKTKPANKEIKYLFFDLEKASSFQNQVHVCEFGYVLTNEKFDVLEKRNFVIDPKIERNQWDYFAVRKILTRTINQYENSLDFEYFCPYILKLIQNADYVFGHTTESDVDALNQEMIRHSHDPLKFAFYDIKDFYKAYANEDEDVGLSKMVEVLGVEGRAETQHDALADAYNTMLCTKSVLLNMGISLKELIQLSNEAKYKRQLKNMEQTDLIRLAADDGSNQTCGRHKHNLKMYLIYLDNIKVKDNGIFKGQKVSISLNYEEGHYRQSLNLVRLISEQGGQVVLKASSANIVVSYDLKREDGTLRRDSRVEYALEAKNNGSQIEIITFKELLSKLKINEAELDSMEYPSFDFVYEDGAIIRNAETKDAVERMKARKKAAN